MIIDANSYWFDEHIFHDETLCEQFLAEVPRAYDTEGYLTMNSAGKRQIVIEMPAGSPGLNYIEGDYTLEKRLADMDEAGVDKAILKLPGCHEWMSLEMCRRFNDGMAADAKASNGRLIPLVAVPPFGTKANLEELDRRLDDGFAGVQLCAHYGKRYLDDQVFSSFFRAPERTPCHRLRAPCSRAGRERVASRVRQPSPLLWPLRRPNYGDRPRDLW